MPIAVFFARRGHAIYRVSLAKAADLRRHANQTGSTPRRWHGFRWPARAGCSSLSCPAQTRQHWTGGSGPAGGSPKPPVSARPRSRYLARQLMPVTPLTGDLGTRDLAMLERYADSRALLAAGLAELTTPITTAPDKQQGQQRARQ
jgi:hypothetical protein